MSKVDYTLYTFLVEEAKMSLSEFNVLTEETKLNFVTEIANEVLENIKNKMATLDLTSINKTRGEIKNFTDLDVIQNTVLKLTNLVNGTLETIDPKLIQYVKEIAVSIKNLSKYSYLFKEAYRNKKTILILRYQSIIMSIISALSYLVSVSIDFKDANHLKIKDKISVEEIAPISSLIEFNRSVENGTFGTEIKDVDTLREFYSEYTVQELSTIYEAVDIVTLINNGINSFSNFLNNGNRNNILLKAAGIIVLILSLRQAFYAIANSKNKISDMIGHLKQFLNIQNNTSLSSLTRFITFNNKNVINQEKASEITSQEINSENKNIISAVKNKPTVSDTVTDFVPQQISDNSEEEATKQSNIFADFNF